MSTAAALEETLRALEEELLAPATRSHAARLLELLADDFEEVGASGRRFDRDAMIAALLQESSEEPPSLSMEAFRIVPLADGLVLARYRSRRASGAEVRIAERSTLWRRGAAGWQALYHQGTVVPAVTHCAP